MDNSIIQFPPWISDFPKVAHYTTFEGLRGILSTKQLWATHYQFLNDTSEMEHGKKHIGKIWQQQCDKVGLSSPNEAWWKVFTPNDDHPEFFITSFCGVPAGNIDLESDGLLSQWRGYGGQGGFAIILIAMN